MVRPRLHDDGQTVTLDLHGVRVAEAGRLAVALVDAAARHGRSSVRLIHGSSTTGPHGGDRTIKRAFHQLLDDGDLAPHVTSSFRGEDVLLLGIAPSPSPRAGFLRLTDLI